MAVVDTGFRGFGVPDLLRTVASLGFSRCQEGSAFICAMSLLATSEAESLSNALGMISQRELFQADGVDIHGIGIFGRMQVGGERREG